MIKNTNKIYKFLMGVFIFYCANPYDKGINLSSATFVDINTSVIILSVSSTERVNKYFHKNNGQKDILLWLWIRLKQTLK